jgi:CRISPR system Cascade subunit CasB
MENSIQSSAEQFVQRTITRCHVEEDKGLRARLRRADNPALQYQSWDYFAWLGIDLKEPTKYLPYAAVASAIAKTKKLENGRDGSLSLGRAIAKCYPVEKGNKNESNDQAQAKLRRVLACQDIRELYRALRPLFSLIESRVPQPLGYVHLLKQLNRFSDHPDSVKAEWAMEFYHKPDDRSVQECA